MRKNGTFDQKIPAACHNGADEGLMARDLERQTSASPHWDRPT